MAVSYNFFILKEEDDFSDFSCGDSDDHKKLNRFLKEKALSHQKEFVGTTLVVKQKEEEKVIAFMTLMADGIIVRDCKKSFLESVLMKNNYDTYPALKIGRIAVDTNHQKNGVGKYLFKMAVAIAKISNNHMGVRFIVVDAKDIARDWYLTKLDFRVLDTNDKNYLYYDLMGWKKNE